MEETASKLRFEWRDHSNELSKLSRELFGQDDLSDVTLTCRGGAAYHAHKMVLVAASTYFRNFFKEVKGKITQHQVIFMKDIEPAIMEHILQFLYLGEVEVPNDDVEAIIKISRELGVVGLSTIKTKEESEDGHSARLGKRKLDPIHNLDTAKKEKIDSELCEKNEFIDNTEEIDDIEDCEDEEAEDDEDVEEDEEEEEDDETEEDEVEDELQENGEHEEDEEESYLLPYQDDQINVTRQSLFQRRIDREKEERSENSLLIGSIIKKIEGRKKGYYYYIIGDYIYRQTAYARGINHTKDGSKLLVVVCSSTYNMCKGRAFIDPETMKVIKFTSLHSCTRDPDRKFQIEMESEMKHLADTTTDSPREIFNRISKKHPSVAAKMEFHRCSEMMKHRRKKAAMM